MPDRQQRRKHALLLVGARNARNAAFGDIGLRHVDEGPEVHHDLQYGPRQDGDLPVILRERSVLDGELALTRVEPEQCADPAAVLGRRVRCRAHVHQDGLRVVDGLDPKSHAAGGLRLAHQGHELVELRVARTRIAGAAKGIVQAVDRVHADPQHDIGGVAALNEVQQARDRDRGHQALGELVADQGLVGDRGLVRESSGGAHGADVAAAGRGELTAKTDVAFKRVRTDD